MDKLSETYELEYGTDSLEMNMDAIKSGSDVLIMNDLLYTSVIARAVKISSM